MMTSIESLMPADTPRYMLAAWLGCVRWAAGNPELVMQFKADTNPTWTIPQTPLDRLIDQAAGTDWAHVEAFVQWVNVNVWGSIDGPGDLA